MLSASHGWPCPQATAPEDARDGRAIDCALQLDWLDCAAFKQLQ